MISKRTKERILKYIDKWKSRLLLDGWTVIVKFAEKDRPESVRGSISTSTVAEMGINQRYLEGNLLVFPAIEEEITGSQEASILHELIHIHTHPVHEALHLAVSRGVLSEKKMFDILEGLTETMTKIVLKAYTNKRKKLGEFQI